MISSISALITLRRGWPWPMRRSNRSLACAQIQAKRISLSPSICTGVISITTTLASELRLAQKSLPNEPWSFEILRLSSIDGRAGGMNRPKILSAPSSSTRKTLPSSNNSLLVMCVCAVMPMKSVYMTAQSLLLPKMPRCELHAPRSNSTGMPIRIR